MLLSVAIVDGCKLAKVLRQYNWLGVLQSGLVEGAVVVWQQRAVVAGQKVSVTPSRPGCEEVVIADMKFAGSRTVELERLIVVGMRPLEG